LLARSDPQCPFCSARVSRASSPRFFLDGVRQMLAAAALVDITSA
jgi:hypothetical protein